MPPTPRGTPVKTEQLLRVLERTKGKGTCRSCDASIMWYRTYPGDKAMPFDGDPVPRASALSPIGDVIIDLPADDVHFRSCPNADQHRRPR